MPRFFDSGIPRRLLGAWRRIAQYRSTTSSAPLAGARRKGAPKAQEIEIGRAYSGLSQEEAVLLISLIVRKFSDRRILMLVDGEADSGKSTFCEKLVKRMGPFTRRLPELLLIDGSALDDYLDTTRAAPFQWQNMKEQYRWIFEQREEYGRRPFVFNLAKYFELNFKRLFGQQPPFRLVIFDYVSSIGYIEEVLEVTPFSKLSGVVTVSVELTRNPPDSPSYNTFCIQVD